MIITRAMPTQQTAITGVSRRITAGQEIKAELCRGPEDTAVNLFTGSILTADVVQTAPLKVRAESPKATQYVVVGQEISATLVWELPIVVGPDQLVPLKTYDR